MNFKTFLEKTEEETEPKIVNFKREKKERLVREQLFIAAIT